MSGATKIAIAWATVVVILAANTIRNEVAEYDPPLPAAYPIGQPGATPMPWPSPTGSVPTAVPIVTRQIGGWVSCANRKLMTPVAECQPQGD